MYTGSSAYFAEENKQFDTPKIRIQMGANDFLTRGTSNECLPNGSPIAGSSQNFQYHFTSGVYFNNTYYVAGNIAEFGVSSTTVIGETMYIFTQGRTSLGAGGSWSLTNPIGITGVSGNAYLTGFKQKLFVETTVSGGNSLYYFYTGITGVHRQGLEGGNWGSTTLVINGTLKTATGLSVVGVDCAVLNENKIYHLAYDADNSSSISVFRTQNTGSWGTTLSYRSNKYTEYQDDNSVIYAFNIGDNKDAIIRTYNSLTNPVVNTIITDGINSFGSYDYFQTQQGFLFLNPQIYMAKGSSLFHLFMIHDVTPPQSIDIVGNLGAILNQTFLSYSTSADCINWSNPIFLEDLTNRQFLVSFVSDLAANLIPIAINDSTELDLILLSGRSPMYKSPLVTGSGATLFGFNMYQFSHGVTNLDISSNIIDFTNNNNQSIDLTLGNYK